MDELAGLCTACALVRPSRSVNDLEPSSVKKKMKDKAFARGVNRDDVLRGAAELGVDLDAHIALVIRSMRDRADLLGLGGSVGLVTRGYRPATNVRVRRPVLGV